MSDHPLSVEELRRQESVRQECGDVFAETKSQHSTAKNQISFGDKTKNRERLWANTQSSVTFCVKLTRFREPSALRNDICAQVCVSRKTNETLSESFCGTNKASLDVCASSYSFITTPNLLCLVFTARRKALPSGMRFFSRSLFPLSARDENSTDLPAREGKQQNRMCSIDMKWFRAAVRVTARFPWMSLLCHFDQNAELASVFQLNSHSPWFFLGSCPRQTPTKVWPEVLFEGRTQNFVGSPWRPRPLSWKKDNDSCAKRKFCRKILDAEVRGLAPRYRGSPSGAQSWFRVFWSWVLETEQVIQRQNKTWSTKEPWISWQVLAFFETLGEPSISCFRCLVVLVEVVCRATRLMNFGANYLTTTSRSRTGSCCVEKSQSSITNCLQRSFQKFVLLLTTQNFKTVEVKFLKHQTQLWPSPFMGFQCRMQKESFTKSFFLLTWAQPRLWQTEVEMTTRSFCL